MSSHTSLRLKAWLLDGENPSRGALADYGFDPEVYERFGRPIPTQEQFVDLSKRYDEILQKESNIEALHNALISGHLHDILGCEFCWVCSISNPYNFTKETSHNRK